MIRTDVSTVDLDVRGAVRRYKNIGSAWLDVTTLYPPSGLPAALAAF
jgi:hypothetical protein